jgi:hypothetical protein
MFMFASRAALSSASGSAGSTRAGKLSNGMTFAPLAKIGVPLTTKPNAPCLRSSVTVRRPMVRVCVSPSKLVATV